MTSQLIVSDNEQGYDAPDADYDRDSVWTVEKANRNSLRPEIVPNGNSRRSSMSYLDIDGNTYTGRQPDIKRTSSIIDDGERCKEIKDKIQKALFSKENSKQMEEEKDKDTLEGECYPDIDIDVHVGRKEGNKQQHQYLHPTPRRKMRIKQGSRRELPRFQETSSSESDCNEVINTQYEKGNNEESNNWTLKKNNTRGEYLKITIEDLQKLIKDNVASAVSMLPNETGTEMKPLNKRGQPHEFDTTDSEAAISFSSGNSMDALLPVPDASRADRRATLHLVNPTRIGILKRFLPHAVGDYDSSASNTTAETFLSSGKGQSRRHSFQIDMMRSQPDRQNENLHVQSNMLRGKNMNRFYTNKDYIHDDFPKRNLEFGRQGRRHSNRFVSFDFDNECFDSASIDDDSIGPYDMPIRHGYNCCNTDYRTPHHWQKGIHRTSNPHIHRKSFVTDTPMLYPSNQQQQNIPQIMVSAPAPPVQNPVVPSATNNIENEVEKVILKRIHDVLNEKVDQRHSLELKASDSESDKSEDEDTEDTKDTRKRETRKIV